MDPREIDAVLDASGFAFSDQWGSSGAFDLLKKMETPARRGKPLILLPQALGPFRNAEVAAASRALFRRASLVCARDTLSHEAATELGVSSDVLRQYPDFTVGIAPQLPQGFQLPKEFSAIVPNLRMMDKGASASTYLDFLSRSISLLQSRAMNPVFVLHDAEEDRKVIERIYATGISIPVIEHEDPRVLKAILGRATLVIGSRFHALVSSLSQGVPCIGAGWSHKYPELFSAFAAVDLLVSDLNDAEYLEKLIVSLANPSQRQAISSKIFAAVLSIKQRTDTMWTEVESLLRRLADSQAGR
jgi:colanic acid/amylovoran biosynthesis protein